ncbi:hypothetical protein LCGC14_1761580 [marine sediment metagenome]|uniref:Uncharacterized protein n=1 Tax=marine sediment metagenome TaxID=412755 RepID=A0A0F9JFW5_9ZZZZ
MGFPVIAAIAGASVGISAAKNFFGGRGDRQRTSEAISNLESLRPEIKRAGEESTGIQREAVEGFRNFDAMAGFDEELAARTRAPLESVQARSNESGTFRSGRRIQGEQEVIGREAATLLTARQRLQLQGYAGLSGAGAQLGETSLDFIGAKSELESGFAEFFEGRSARRNKETMDMFRMFMQTQGAGG